MEPIFEVGRDCDIALSCADREITYQELRGHILRVSNQFTRKGIRPGDRVLLACRKSVGAVVGLLAILATGAACVPLDANISMPQLFLTMQELAPRLIICDHAKIVEAIDYRNSDVRNKMRLENIIDLCFIDEDTMSIDFVDTFVGDPVERSSPEASLLLRTSGSTGASKTIMLTDDNVATFVNWAAKEFEINASDRLANHAPLQFDLSTFDLFAGLGRGARVHLIDEVVGRFPGAVKAVIEKIGITVWYSAPTALVQLQERRGLRDAGALRLVMFAGETFPTPILRRLMDDLPKPEYANLYGPAETNVCTFFRLPAPPASDTEAIPIGYPCTHSEVRILTADGAIARAGETGEICVAGPSVMLGYWNQPEMTASSRVAHWRSDSYRTGDYGRRREDGAILFVGRRDQQVKIRGRRIELLALETVLNGHPEIRQAAALSMPGLKGIGSLWVFVAPRREPLSAGAVREFIRERLPTHYAPDFVEGVAEMPRNANGKIDRARLREFAESAMGK